MASGLPAHVEEADLISYGLLGLIGAIERYDPEREIKFETFAVSRIKGAIIDELRSLDWVPRSVRARAREIEKAHAKLENDLRRTPTEEEMAEKLEMDLDEFRDALLEIANSSVLALDDLWTVADPGGGQISLLDTIRDPSAVDPQEEIDANELKDRLAERDRGAPRPRAARDRPLLLREPDPAGDRRGPRGDRVARVPAPHEGRDRPALEPAARRLAAPARPYIARMGQPPDRIRNVALIGHRGSGKTSLNEAILFEAGVVNRLGRVEDGSTVSDFEPDEQEREMSIGASVASFEHAGRKINLIDTPGESSFIADTLATLRVVDAAVVVVNAVMGVEVHTERLWSSADEEGLARLVFVNMLDRERADFFRALDSLKEAFGPHVVATEIPIGTEHEVRGVVDLIDMKAFEYEGDGRDSAEGDPGARGARGPGGGVPREADGRGRGELRRADGALPRGRGDLARGDRHGAEAGRDGREAVPGDLRRGDEEPRHQPPARGAGRGPSLAGDARGGRRPAAGWGGARDRARPGWGPGRLRVQDARGPLRRAHQPAARLLGRAEERLPGDQRDAAREGAHRAAVGAPWQGDGADR